MRHVNLVPKLSWYLAPTKHKGSEEWSGHVHIMNEDGKTKYEFWMNEEDQTDEFYRLFREYNNGTIVEISVLKEQFEIEEYSEAEVEE